MRSVTSEMRSVTSRQFRRTPGRVGLPEARTETLVVTRWKEDVWEYRGRVIFDIRNHPQLPQWQRRQAHHERTANLVWARDHCGGLFRIVWLKAKDPNEGPQNNPVLSRYGPLDAHHQPDL
jgi:hypothetical protein